MTSKGIPLGSSIAIIGAGIVGVASACALMRQGYKVSIFDPSHPGEAGSSMANAGHIGASDIYPLSTPGIHWKAIKMLMDSNAPLKISFKEFWLQLPWFWRFWRTSHASNFESATKALSYLCQNSIDDTRELFEYCNMGDMLDHKGCMFIYDTEESFNSSLKSWIDKKNRGFSSEVIDLDQLNIRAPYISNKFKYAVLSHNWGQVSDPLEVVKSIAKIAEKGGVIFHQNRVNSISKKNNSIELATDKGTDSFDAVIIAAGIGSVDFAKSCGDYLPMASERGYNLTIPSANIKNELPLVFADRGVVTTSLSSGFRIGGWAEYSNSKNKANQDHFKSIARISRELFPEINIDNAKYWMGSRPSTPDSVPVISCSQKMDRIFYNCGHGHYGLTHAATSAKILCKLLVDSADYTEHEGLSINRFL
jgi:D-amino-acid dehydrogenase